MKPCIEVYAPKGRAAEYSVRVLTQPEPEPDHVGEAAKVAKEALISELIARSDCGTQFNVWALEVKGKRWAVFATATGLLPADS